MRPLNSILLKAKNFPIRQELRTVKNRDFTIISSNCTGSIFYKLMGIPFSSPTINLFFNAPCFLKFLCNMRFYLDGDLIFVEKSIYWSEPRSATDPKYPIGRIYDIEIHFLHYASEAEAKHLWDKRKSRINMENLFIMFTDKDFFSYELLEKFDNLPFKKKVCFTSKPYPEFESSTYLPFFKNRSEVGNIFVEHHSLKGAKNWKNWFDE